jgi:hypothetical protein
VTAAPRIILIAALLPLCWLAMQVVHEAGHVVAAWATGGTVTVVVLHPLAISRTDVSPNPHPLAVVWAGPVVGSLIPLLAWLQAMRRKLPATFLWRFFAGFCLIANGVYLGTAIITPVGDAADLVRLGMPVWSMAVFGGIATVAGFVLWNGLGPSFGIGADPQPVSLRHAIATVLLFVAIVLGEFVWTATTEYR